MTKKRFVLIVLTLVALLFLGTALVGQTADKSLKTVFSADDRKAIDVYYKHLFGEVAPGSLDRKDYSSEIERTLKPGGKVPMQLEKELEWLPAELEKQLSQPQGGYLHYKLGRHILIVRRSDFGITDIIKDAGLK